MLRRRIKVSIRPFAAKAAHGFALDLGLDLGLGALAPQVHAGSEAAHEDDGGQGISWESQDFLAAEADFRLPTQI